MIPGICEETRNRILVSVHAYAYEVKADPLISDAEFDDLAMEINPDVSTGRAKEDAFFAEHFDSFSGSWIHAHPDLVGVKRIYNIIKTENNK